MRVIFFKLGGHRLFYHFMVVCWYYLVWRFKMINVHRFAQNRNVSVASEKLKLKSRSILLSKHHKQQVSNPSVFLWRNTYSPLWKYQNDKANSSVFALHWRHFYVLVQKMDMTQRFSFYLMPCTRWYIKQHRR